MRPKKCASTWHSPIVVHHSKPLLRLPYVERHEEPVQGLRGEHPPITFTLPHTPRVPPPLLCINPNLTCFTHPRVASMAFSRVEKRPTYFTTIVDIVAKGSLCREARNNA